MSPDSNCRNCGAPLAPGLEVCTYCGVRRRPERPGEFGLRTHAWFWSGLAVVSAGTVGLGLAHLRRETSVGEGGDWTLLFGVLPSILLVVAATWGPRRGRWGSAVFCLVPALALTIAMAVAGELHDIDMLGYPAASAGACLVAFGLGSALHEWIVTVRRP